MPHLDLLWLEDTCDQYRTEGQPNPFPFVANGDHPRFTPFYRFDWGFYKVATGHGWSLTYPPIPEHLGGVKEMEGEVRLQWVLEHRHRQVAEPTYERSYDRNIRVVSAPPSLQYRARPTWPLIRDWCRMGLTVQVPGVPDEVGAYLKFLEEARLYRLSIGLNPGIPFLNEQPQGYESWTEHLPARDLEGNELTLRLAENGDTLVVTEVDRIDLLMEG